MKESTKDFAADMPTAYLRKFFAEKNLPVRVWELEDKNGVTHMISNLVVVDAMTQVNAQEAAGLEDMLTKIDFHNGDVNDYLKHLAGALINR